MMPDLSCPRQVNGRLYCWDRANREIVEITLVPVNLTDCDKRVIAAFVDDYGRLGEDSDAYTRR